MVITHAVQIGQKMENENQPVLGGKPAAKEQPIWATEKPAAEEVPAEPSVLDQPAVEEAPAEPAVEQPAEPVVEEPVAEEPIAEEPVVAEQPAEQPVVTEEPAAVEQPAAAEKPKKKKSKAWIFILIFLLLIGAGVAVFFLFFFNKGGEELSYEKKEPEPEAYTAAYKLKIDYEAGGISVDEYVKQLTYTEYDSSKLDEKYKSDEGAAGDNNIQTILDLISENYDDISTETINEFAKHYVLADVTFGSGKKTISKASNDIVLAAEKQGSYLTTLNKVIMSEDGNFLVWYTEEGDSKITTEQAKRIAKTLAESVKKYTEITGYQYDFGSIDAINEDVDGKKLMKEALAEQSNIPKNKVTDAMSVYVYDTKSESTLATYHHLSCLDDATTCKLSFLLNRLADSDTLKSSAVTWPYITVNNRFVAEGDELDQTINHELFHHYQNKLICQTDSVKYGKCKGGKQYNEYTEALANYFSSKVSGGSDSNYILNIWSGRFSNLAYLGVKDIEYSGLKGYGQWPFYYSYEKYVDNGTKYIIEAHKKDDPYAYLNSATTTDILRKVMNEAAYLSISKEYPIDPMKNDKPVTFENDSDDNFDLKFTIPGGGIQYYSLGQNWSITFTTTSKDTVTGLGMHRGEFTHESELSTLSAILLGKKDGKYEVIKTEENSASLESGSFSGYTDFVLAITNADLVEGRIYQLKYTQKDDPNAISLRHRYNNYAVEYEMTINMAGITTTATGKGRVDEKHQRSYLETTMKTLMGIEANMVTYSDFYNGIDYYTNPKDMLGGGLGDLMRLFTESEGEESAKWLKTNTASHTIDIDLVARKLRDAKQTQKVSDGHYKVKMTAKEMNDLMNTANSADDKNKTQYEFKNGTIEVDVYISEFGYISKLDYDFSSLVEGIDKFTCTMKLSDYNRAGDVLIPESVRYGATEEQL